MSLDAVDASGDVSGGLDPRWMSAVQLAGLGLCLDRPHTLIGSGWGTDRDIRLTFSSGPDGHRGVLYAHRDTPPNYLLLATNTTHHSVHAAVLGLGDAFTDPQGHLRLAAQLDSQPTLTARAAHTYWFDCLETEFALLHAFRQTPPGAPERASTALACSAAGASRVSAEHTYIYALRENDCEPVIVTFRLDGLPGWSARLAAPSLRAVELDVDYAHRLARDYRLSLHAEPPAHNTITTRSVQPKFAARPFDLSM